ncbi:hypothetical protein NIA69_04650 [Gemmiger formicilis]|nr:hypothetical protein [Gemmiger formicilis]
MAVLNGERMHNTMERLLPGARSAALLWQGAAVLGGAALGAGQVYGGAAPFGLALVIGCPPSYCLAAALGTLAAGWRSSRYCWASSWPWLLWLPRRCGGSSMAVPGPGRWRAA